MSIIEGLTIVPNAIDKAYREELMKEIDKESWSTVLKRRTQHYGYEYDYFTKTLSDAKPLPDWAKSLCNHLEVLQMFALHISQQVGLVKGTPEQLIVNEYTKGQRISKHKDASVFGETIFSVSLGDPCFMLFSTPSKMKRVQVGD